MDFDLPQNMHACPPFENGNVLNILITRLSIYAVLVKVQ